MLTTITYGHTQTRLNEVKTVKNVDILFIGSSHVYRGFDTRIFQQAGYSSFNLGSSSQTPIQSLFLLNRYLKSIRPKSIVFEVNPELLAADGVESELDLLLNDKIAWDNVRSASKIGNIKVFNTLIYSFINQSFDTKIKQKSKQDDDLYITGGFVEKDLKYNTKPSDFKAISWKFNKKQIDAVDEICSNCKKQNIAITFVFAPINSSLYSSWKNIDEFAFIIAKKGNYIDANNAILYDDSLDFFDELHLNQTGVQKFNLAFIKEMKQKKFRSL
jgi:hypothetical protein